MKTKTYPKKIFITSIFPNRRGWYAVGSTKQPSKDKCIFILFDKRKMFEYPVWITLDLSNGQEWLKGTTNNYLWIDHTKRVAERRYKKHKNSNYRLARLSCPLKYEACYWDDPLMLVHF